MSRCAPHHGALAGLLCLLAGVGCGVSFPDEFLIEDLRVLNIRAEPPEVSIFGPLEEGESLQPLDLQTLPPTVSGTVTFTALVAHPDLNATFTFDWIQCTPGLRSVPCEPSEKVRLDPNPSDSLNLSVVGVLTDALLAEENPDLTQLFSGDPRDLFNGIRAHVNLSVGVDQAAVPVDTLELEATKRVVIFDPRVVATTVLTAQQMDASEVPNVDGLDLPSLCVGASQAQVEAILEFLETRTPNQSPKFQVIRLARVGGGVDTSTRTLGPSDVLEIAPSQIVELSATATVDSTEAYQVIDGNCFLQSFVERMSFSWFTSRGELTRQLTTDNRPSTQYTAPNAADLTEDSTPVRLWVVLRDGRGGSTHRAIDLRIVK